MCKVAASAGRLGIALYVRTQDFVVRLRTGKTRAQIKLGFLRADPEPILHLSPHQGVENIDGEARCHLETHGLIKDARENFGELLHMADVAVAMVDLEIVDRRPVRLDVGLQFFCLPGR